MKENTTATVELAESALTLAIAFIWALLAAFWSYKKQHRFRLPPFHIHVVIKGSQLFFSFALFLFTQLIIAPLLFLIHQKQWPFLNSSSETLFFLKFNLLVLSLTYFFLALFYYFDFSLQQKKSLFHFDKAWYQNFLKGAVSWVFIYPFVLFVSALLDTLIFIIFDVAPSNQNVVEQFKLALSSAPLTIWMTFTIACIVPVAEEFLFRGLLQSWLKQRFENRMIAIAISALVFALFHYSSEQGVTNLQLLTTLFLLGSFLGYLYEKYNTLWASIGLHSTFNFISALLIGINQL